MNTLEVFTELHIGVTNVVYKHPLGVKRRAILAAWDIYPVVSTPLRVYNKHPFYSVGNHRESTQNSPVKLLTFIIN